MSRAIEPSAKALVKVRLPADAKLYMFDVAATGTGTERVYETQPLQRGMKFFYTLKAEVMIDGQLVSEERRVILEAGSEVSESFPKLLAAAAGTKPPATGTPVGATVAAGK